MLDLENIPQSGDYTSLVDWALAIKRWANEPPKPLDDGQEGKGLKDEIIKLQDEYIEFLDRESSPFISFAFTHNMVVPEKVVNEGKAYREKIANLKRQSEGQPAQWKE